MPNSLPTGVKIPTFDKTLGALFIGSNIATILYGVICLQTFIYITSPRSQSDRWWLKTLVYLLLWALDSAHQLTMTAAIYKFLVSDYLNPALLPTAGAGSGEIFTFAQSCIGAILILFVQLFFCWRIWIFSMPSLRFAYRLLFTGLTISLALLSYASSMDLAVTGFNHRLSTANTRSFILAYKLSTSSKIAFDVMVTIAMTITLRRVRSEVVGPTDNIIRILILFTVNTNLITTCLSISELVTFLALPQATVYGGIGFLLAKTYLNSFLALLNSREYLREKLDRTSTTLATLRREPKPTFAVLPQYNRSVVEGSSTAANAREIYELDRASNFKPDTNDNSLHGMKFTRADADAP